MTVKRTWEIGLICYSDETIVSITEKSAKAKHKKKVQKNERTLAFTEYCGSNNVSTRKVEGSNEKVS